MVLKSRWAYPEILPKRCPPQKGNTHLSFGLDRCPMVQQDLWDSHMPIPSCTVERCQFILYEREAKNKAPMAPIRRLSTFSSPPAKIWIFPEGPDLHPQTCHLPSFPQGLLTPQDCSGSLGTHKQLVIMSPPNWEYLAPSCLKDFWNPPWSWFQSGPPGPAAAAP